MKYCIMCGGVYGWSRPRQLTEINGERIVDRTMRLLMEEGILNKDIMICVSPGTREWFKDYYATVLNVDNDYNPAAGHMDWVNGFMKTDHHVCYLFGDVYYSPDAIHKIVETETSDIAFFASAPPFSENYIKPYAEPFAFKVVDTSHFFASVEMVKDLDRKGQFARIPIAWELWQVIKGTELNRIITNYEVINDYTCDVDYEGDIEKLEKIVKSLQEGSRR